MPYIEDMALRIAFITRFPEEIALKLQQVTDFEKIEVRELIPTAKILASSRPSKVPEVVTVS